MAATGRTPASGQKVEVPHEFLQPGDSCPEHQKGTVYETGRPGVLVRLVGQAPLAANPAKWMAWSYRQILANTVP